jgi:hypothetical protein
MGIIKKQTVCIESINKVCELITIEDLSLDGVVPENAKNKGG